MKLKKNSLSRAGLCVGFAIAGSAQAEGLSDFDISISGYIRSETAFRTSNQENPYNQRGNLFNGVPTQRDSTAVLGFVDTVTRNGDPADNSINLQQFRAQLDTQIKFTSNLSLTAKLRGIVDPGFYDEYQARQVNSQVTNDLYKKPNYFNYDVDGRSAGQPLEIAGRNYQLYFPALFLEYNQGPLDVRIGNQQIAWGQALFFRVLDVVDGLDLRRHSALDFAAEEFSDKRVPSLGIRTTYQIGQNWLGEAFVQKFQPTVYSNPNTPYNAIASQFTVHDLYGEVDSKVNFGLRFKGQFTESFGGQAIAVRRFNPDGVYRWTRSGVNRDLGGLPAGNGTGALLQDTAFEVDPTGVNSADEWFTYAAAARLSGTAGLDASIREFAAAQALGAFEVIPATGGDPNSQAAYDLAKQELNLFFQLSGSGLRGHIAREYKAENVYGGGLSYVTSASPGSLLDQLIVNVEGTYVPNKTFTATSLTRDYDRRNEWTVALVSEKYQRISQSFPATYFLFQFIHKSESDLFGRLLDGYNGSRERASKGVKGGYNAFAFAFQQPFPNLVWRFDFAALYDARGGLLVQPAVRWKPNGTVTVEAFYNYLNGRLGGNENTNAISTFEYADEISLRVGYQF